MRNKWCKLHNDIRHNYKLNVSSYKERWVYFCYLTLETDGTLDKAPPDHFLAREVGLTVEEFREVRASMIEVGLLDENGRVKNFHKRQYTPEAERKAAQRSRYRSQEDSVTSHVTVTGTCHAPEAEAEAEAEAETEEEKKKTPPPRSITEIPFFDEDGVLVVSVVAKGGSEVPITARYLRKWEEAFPAVNVVQELKKAAAWCEAQPDQKRWTPAGVRRGLFAWLSRSAQDGARIAREQSKPSPGQSVAPNGDGASLGLLRSVKTSYSQDSDPDMWDGGKSNG